MNTNDISGSVFDSLQIYAGVTDTEADDKRLDILNRLILAAVPGVDAREVGEKIDELRRQNPNWTMDQVFEAAVKSLNSACSDDAIHDIKKAWEAFTGVSDLSSDDILEILQSPVTFAIQNSGNIQVTLRKAIEKIMLIMLEIAGMESANMLEEGFAEVDNILALGEKKANDILTKGIIEGVTEIGTGVLTAMGSAASMYCSVLSLGFSSNQALSQAFSGIGQAISGLYQALGSMAKGGAGIAGSALEAENARTDAESQAAGVRKEVADQLRQAAIKVYEACQSLLKLMGQSDKDLATAIGRA